MSKNEIVKKQNEIDTTDYYANVKIDLSDLIIPKITLMQKGSKKVEEEEAKVGEFRDNVSNKLLGDKKTNLVIAPIAMIDKIYLETVKDNKNNDVSYREYLYDKDNPLPKQEDHPEGVLTRQEAFRLYCLPINELEEYIKENAIPIPYVLTFKGTSHYAGRQVLQAQFLYRNMRKPPFALSFEISSTYATSKVGNHTFYKMEIKKTEPIVDEKKLALLKKLHQDMSSINSVNIAEDNNEQFF